MTLRIRAAASALSLFLLACPAPQGGKDGGEDAGDASVGTGTCTETCGEAEVCNVSTRSCVSRCGGGGGCDGGICAKVSASEFACRPNVTSCNGVVCAAGQNTCIAGKCSCTPAARGARDSCADEGRICAQPYNPTTMTGGDCKVPLLYDECKTTGCPSGNCPACPSGQACQSLFAGDRKICLRTCTVDTSCAGEEFCFSRAGFPNQGTDRCYPTGVFGFPCESGNPDGGANLEVPVSAACRRWTAFPNTTEPTAASTCAYSFFRLSTGEISTTVCRPPGTVGLHAECKLDSSRSAGATQCAAGLQCVPTRGDTGICMKICNAVVPTPAQPNPQPACAAGQACVNLFRQEDPNAVLGVCMGTCSVFTQGAGNGCTGYADGGLTAAASCVPVPADGRSLVSLDGSGLCIPQLASVAAAKQPCTETDSFRGAACATGLLCSSASVDDSARCAQPCDLGCIDKPDGGALPARCATEANARCTGGTTCGKLTSTTGATLGFCQ